MREIRSMLQQTGPVLEGKAGHLMFKSNPLKQNWEKYWVVVNHGMLSFYKNKKVHDSFPLECRIVLIKVHLWANLGSSSFVEHHLLHHKNSARTSKKLNI